MNIEVLLNFLKANEDAIVEAVCDHDYACECRNNMDRRVGQLYELVENERQRKGMFL